MTRAYKARVGPLDTMSMIPMRSFPMGGLEHGPCVVRFPSWHPSVHAAYLDPLIQDFRSRISDLLGKWDSPVSILPAWRKPVQQPDRPRSNARHGSWQVCSHHHAPRHRPSSSIDAAGPALHSFTRCHRAREVTFSDTWLMGASGATARGGGRELVMGGPGRQAAEGARRGRADGRRRRDPRRSGLWSAG